jgi:cyclopropane fatty-acyl-phospholipid synthase-like methyltransferase
VRRYYDDCWNDYRILWRTDENGSIHFGFFDEEAGSALPRLKAAPKALIRTAGAIAAALAAGVMAATGLAWGRTYAVRCLQFAARGNAARHDAAQARMTDVCARAVGLRRGERVLDAGCGVGGTDVWLASRFAVSVVGINVQQNHLREAQQTTAHHPAGSLVHLSAQDFTQMAIVEGAIDVVWGLESVCHCSDKLAFIREAYRVLRQGGRLMVADFFRRTDDPRVDQAERLRTWADGWALHLASIAGFRADLEQVGFRDIVFRDVGTNVVKSSLRLYKASLVARPINVVLEGFGFRSSLQGANIRASYEQYCMLREGAWTYGIFVAQKTGATLTVEGTRERSRSTEGLGV